MPFRKLHAVHVPHRKNTAKMPAVRMPLPSTVILPVSMHIGAPAKITVAPGEHVKIGQVVAESGGFVSAPVHATVSGTVKKIDSFLLSSGVRVPAVIIASDGEGAVHESVVPPEVTDRESFIEAVRRSGLVGLGGAGFPTSVKLAPKDPSLLETVIVNGAECEPYITSDTRTMIDDAAYVAKGLELVCRYLNPKRAVVAIEKNKPEAIQAMRQALGDKALGDKAEVMVLPSEYPQGGEKVLVYRVTGRVVEEGKLPIDAGAIVINCTTLAVMAKYIETGMPLVEKCITVDGGAVMKPMNVIAPIGTPVKEVFSFCGGFKTEPEKVLYGGPMMGVAVPDTDVPVLKNTNALLALTEKESRRGKTTMCIRCGSCVSRCPMNLEPPMIAKAYESGDGAELQKLKVNLCMECGCCQYVCPASRPLVQQNKLGKRILNDYLKKQKGEGK